MIGRLQGIIVDKIQPGKLVIDVNGVGYDVETTLPTFFTLESQSGLVVLLIHTVVREDAFLLYGFHDAKERACFRALIKINGVGPKLAIAILSSMSPPELMQAIMQADLPRLNTIPGVGKKTAERLLIELKGLPEQVGIQLGDVALPIGSSAVQAEEASAALLALGYKLPAVEKAMKVVNDGQKSCEQLIRESLKWLSVKA
ncbi:MAG: Holliday junction branch migration protein RuvA [Legionellaceae bacterium]|nr:Holliday junction branch migration protein RuvA [Legionellaceae bacterium]